MPASMKSGRGSEFHQGRDRLKELPEEAARKAGWPSEASHRSGPAARLGAEGKA